MEAIAVVPMVVLAAAIAWQVVLAGHTLWLCADAARVAARADAVGLSPERAARSALPQSLERGLSVERRARGRGPRGDAHAAPAARVAELRAGGGRGLAGRRAVTGRRLRAERGQATLELLGLLPVLLAVALAGAQLLAVGYSSVLAGNAAEAGALALAGGGDPRARAREALPAGRERRRGCRSRAARCGCGFARPALLRALADRLEVSASAAVEAP